MNKNNVIKLNKSNKIPFVKLSDRADKVDIMTEVDKKILEIDLTHIPHFTNHCKHLDGEYIGTSSYKYIENGKCHVEWIDVYVHKERKSQHVCIRFGEEGSQYYSAGEITNFLKISEQNAPLAYVKALEIILYHGYFKYIKTK